MLMNSCALWQFVKRTFLLLLSENQVSVTYRTLEKGACLRKKVLQFFKIFLNTCVKINISFNQLRFCQGPLNYLKERPLIQKDQISNFQNSQ